MANSVDPLLGAPIGAVCSGFTLFASILNSSELMGNYLQQTTSADRWERSDSVVECLTRDRRAVDLSLTGVTTLWSLSKTHLT